MIGPVEKKPSVRIAGYLEKRGKTRLVMCRWKRWWFVLEGRLLLYYKSQLEYLNLSPCRGSLNMGLASTVRPGKGLELTVITRSQAVTLRAANKVDHEQWLQSLLDAMALPHSNQNNNSRPFMHFRYFNQDAKTKQVSLLLNSGKCDLSPFILHSLGVKDHENLFERVRSSRNASYSVMKNNNSTSRTQSESFEESTTSSSSDSSSSERSRSDKCLLRRVFSDSRTLLERPYKRSADRSSARCSKIAFSDTSIPGSMQAVSLSPNGSSDKCQSMMELRKTLGASCENMKGKESKPMNETETPVSVGKENKLSNSIKIELNLEDIANTSGKKITEQKIGNIKIVLDGCTIYGSRKSSTEKEPEVNNSENKGKRFQNFPTCKTLNWSKNNKEVKSDSELSTVKQQTRAQSLSCENMQTLDRSIGSTYQDICTRQLERERRDQQLLASPQTGSKTNKRRSNSILSRFIVSKPDGENETLERHRTIKKRLSFLRKVWKKREKKPEEEDFESIDYESIPVVIELPSPEVHKAEELLSSLVQEELGPEPEPPPDYDISITEELEVPPLLPPRQKLRRPNSPWHDVPKNNRPVLPPEEEETPPPPLPLKTKKGKNHQVLIKIDHDSSTSVEQSLASSEFDSVLCQPPSQNNEQQKLEDLDTLLVQLSEVNTFTVQQINSSEAHCVHSSLVQVRTEPEPDYDIPRPHMSLIATIRRQNIYKEEISATHFLCTTPLVDMDSLDPVTSRLEAEMTPDSLECDLPWTMSRSESQLHSHSDSGSGSLQYHFITADEKIFPDSLNS